MVIFQETNIQSTNMLAVWESLNNTNTKLAVW
jgi:hypothetical protein